MMIYLNLRSGYYFQWFMISSIQPCRSFESGSRNREPCQEINNLSMFLLYILNFKKLIFL